MIYRYGAFVFFVLGLVCAAFGFSAIEATAWAIAKLLLFLALADAVRALITRRASA